MRSRHASAIRYEVCLLSSSAPREVVFDPLGRGSHNTRIRALDRKSVASKRNDQAKLISKLRRGSRKGNLALFSSQQIRGGSTSGDGSRDKVGSHAPAPYQSSPNGYRTRGCARAYTSKAAANKKTGQAEGKFKGLWIKGSWRGGEAM